ncbi:MAG: hypothetical protein U9N45_07240, partial [Gemmatimonadota bacterium]|nr:hypothetical protein [Gemmatimonadota bacterium]
ELESLFSLEGISRKSAIFDQTKLEWMNGRYLSMMAPEELLKLAEDDYRAEGLIPASGEGTGKTAHLMSVLELVKHRSRLTRDLYTQGRCFFPVELEYDPKAVAKHWKANAAGLMRQLRNDLENTTDWHEEPIERTLRSLAEKLQVSAGRLIHPLRVALTGQSVSPGIFETMALMGRRLILSRLDEALKRFG